MFLKLIYIVNTKYISLKNKLTFFNAMMLKWTTNGMNIPYSMEEKYMGEFNSYNKGYSEQLLIVLTVNATNNVYVQNYC